MKYEKTPVPSTKYLRKDNMNSLKQLWDLVAPFRKALVPLFTGVVLAVLDGLGVTPDMTVEQAVSVALGLVAGGVYLTPNNKQ